MPVQRTNILNNLKLQKKDLAYKRKVLRELKLKEEKLNEK
jgi:hypothetical protein